MKFLFISGAYKNAGDFLIEKRCEYLFKQIEPTCVIEKIMSNVSLDNKLEYVNGFDWIVIPGGPGYIFDYYPSHIKLTSCLDDIKAKIMAVGLGWYGADTTQHTILNYTFSKETQKLLLRISSDCGFLGCRDNYSVQVLRNNGFEKAIMTGCPAWYELEKINEISLRKDIDFNFKKICVSDPAELFENAEQCLKVVRYLRKTFPCSEICFVFHRGIEKDMYTNSFNAKIAQRLKKKLCAMDNITVHNIAFGENGFAVYDDADLHIGYRVHAHIYNLSKRNVSVLIEEDGRGAGVNEALSLPRLLAYKEKARAPKSVFEKAFRKGAKAVGINLIQKSNVYLIDQLDEVLNGLRDEEYAAYPMAFRRMQYSYKRMVDVIEGALY